MPRSAAITVHDVAKRAGVSQPTVSLVLSGHPTARVAPATRAKVHRAAQELGYRPNVVARGLNKRRSFALGIVLPDLRNPVSIDLISGAERVAAQEGYALLLCDARARTIDEHLDELESRWIDGVIVDAATTDEVDLKLRRNVVMINEPSTSHPSVVADMEMAGMLAARHFIGLGHREIGFIGPASSLFRYRGLERGFVRTLSEAGIEIRSDWFRRAPATARGGEAACEGLFAVRSRPTALLCANDVTALGAIKALSTRKLKAPEDMSVLGCDDIEMARLVQPELSTIALPVRELGARAVRTLIRDLQGVSQERRARPLPVHLVARATTAPPA